MVDYREMIDDALEAWDEHGLKMIAKEMEADEAVSEPDKFEMIGEIEQYIGDIHKSEDALAIDPVAASQRRQAVEEDDDE